MFRTAAIAAIATFVGGAASPIRTQLLETPGDETSLGVAASEAGKANKDDGRYRVRLDCADDGLFHAPMWINDQRTTLIVDTGATVTVLTATDAARLGIDEAIMGSKATLRTAGGRSPMRWALIKSARLAGREIVDLQVAIVDSGLPHSLLGQDVLSAGGVLCMEGEVMEIS